MAALHPTVGDLRALVQDHEPPCISLIQPTHRSYPQTQQDPVRFRNLLREAEKVLRQRYPRRDYEDVLGKLRPLADDADLWIEGADALAVFASPEELRVFRLRRPAPPPQVLVVADSFHVKPIVRILQSAERYQVLSLNLARARLFEGTRDDLDPVSLAGVPATIEEALGDQLTEPYLKVTRSYGRGWSGPVPMRHGHGGRTEERKVDRDRFFRVIDREILERFSRPSGLPLLLAALPEHQTPFREISRNPFLLETPIAVNAEALSLEELRQLAWQAIEPLYEQRLSRLREAWAEAKAHGRGTDDVHEAAAAMVQGRIGTLLVEAEKQIPGRIEPTGNVRFGAQAEPGVMDDVLDDLAEGVLRTRGEVVVVPAGRMPTDTGLAATYRY